MTNNTPSQSFRSQGQEVFHNVRTPTPKSVPDADIKTLEEFGTHMMRLFRNKRLPRRSDIRAPLIRPATSESS